MDRHMGLGIEPIQTVMRDDSRTTLQSKGINFSHSDILASNMYERHFEVAKQCSSKKCFLKVINL